MADEIKEGLDKDQVTPKEEPKVESITAEERAELAKLREESELLKRDLKGKDTKITEYQKDLKARMTEEERIKAQAEEERKEWLNDIAKTKADALQLDEKHSALIKGSSKDEINQSAEIVKSLIESVSKEKDKTIKALEDRIKILEANGEPPKKGNKVDSKLIPYADYLKLTAEEQRDYILSGGQIQQQ